MNIKKILTSYLIISGHKGLRNNTIRCRCYLADKSLMVCDDPWMICEVIEKNDKED